MSTEQSKLKKQNLIGLERTDYEGSKSSLCTGCGHDSITASIIAAYFENSVNPYNVAKMSGIGCSSKTPAYFLGKSHGFNSLHGRMAPISTGAKLTNPKLHFIGVSGDGDTASIGLGGFAHLIRRNLPMIYIIENNGVYGLTKGQFSATADYDSFSKSGEKNPFGTIDLCSLSIDLGASFVARSFSGDSKQLLPILSAAMRHRGTAVIDVISPCVTFANHEGSTKSYTYVKEHLAYLNEVGFVMAQNEIQVDYEEGTTQIVEMHDGSHLTLKKLLSRQKDERGHDVSDAAEAIKLLHNSRNSGEVLTGIFYVDESKPSLIETESLGNTPLYALDESMTRPSKESLQQLMQEFK